MAMKIMFRQMFRLVALAVKGPGGKAGVGLYFIVLALELADILVSLRLIAWSKDFYDAVQQMNGAEAARQVGVFAIIVLVGSTRSLSAAYLRKVLVIRWREALTSEVLDRWLAGRAYWRMSQAARDGAIDNPDQRIAEDCRLFLAGPATDHGNDPGVIPLSMDIITNVVGLFSYLAVLWSLSSFALSFSVFGTAVEIPRYMVWAAFIYVALASGLTQVLGAPLKRLYFDQQRREADYRFALARMRENMEPIALSGGEKVERGILDRRFGGIIQNWRKLIGRELILSCFTYPYRFTVLRIPTFLALPAFFAGSVTFGGLMQLSQAFAQVVTTLSWFIFAYRHLADLAAATSRLGRFLEATEQPPSPLKIVVDASADGRLHIRDLRLETPDGRPLLTIGGLKLSPGENVWLSGASGIGKTTLLKALAGLWTHGKGHIQAPAASLVFLPQRPYLPLGDHAAAAAYPKDVAELDPKTINDALAAVGFAPSSGPSGEDVESTAVAGLSGGEQQRLMLARLLIHRPQWAFLDEATGALDQASEGNLLSVLVQSLPETTFVVVAHRKPLGLGALRVIDLDESSGELSARTVQEPA